VSVLLRVCESFDDLSSSRAVVVIGLGCAIIAIADITSRVRQWRRMR
jgi:hypothetical protein